MDEPRKTQFGKRFGTLVGIALGLIVGLWAVPALLAPAEPSVMEMLNEVSAQLNADVPLRIDDATRLTGIEAEAPRTLRYRYEVALDRDSLDADTFRSLLFEQVRRTVRSSAEMEPLKKRDVVFNYHYEDRNGRHITDFDITPDDYE